MAKSAVSPLTLLLARRRLHHARLEYKIARAQLKAWRSEKRVAGRIYHHLLKRRA